MRTWSRAIVLVIVMVGLAVALLVPTVMLLILELRQGGPGGRSGTVGDLVQSISTTMSGVATLGVMAALLIQIRQFRTSQAQGMRMMQIDIFQSLIADPGLRPRSPSYPELSPEVRKQSIFTNMVFKYLELGLEIEYFTPEAVRLELREQLALAEIRALWLKARPKYVAGIRSRKQRRFVELVDAAYRETAPTPPSKRDAPAEMAVPAEPADPR